MFFSEAQNIRSVPKSAYDPNTTPNNIMMSPNKKSCNCRNSRCLKLYCECYANGNYCNPSCNCADCLNNNTFEECRKNAIQSTLERNPTAFQPKIIAASFPDFKVDAPGIGKHNKGCACKKSGCQKKYCECFQAQIPCSENCKCTDCHNTDPSIYQSNPGNNSRFEKYEDNGGHTFLYKLLLSGGNDDMMNVIQTTLANRESSRLSEKMIAQTCESMLRIAHQTGAEFVADEKNTKFALPSDKRSNLSANVPLKMEEENLKLKIEKDIPKPSIDSEINDLICHEEKIESGDRNFGQMDIEMPGFGPGRQPNPIGNPDVLLKAKKARIIQELLSVLRSLESSSP